MQKVLSLALSLFLTVMAFAQTPEADLAAMLEKYPSEHVVVLETSHHIDISLKKGQPVIEERFAEVFFFLDDDAADYSRRMVRYGSFSELDEIEATSYVPVEGKYKAHETTYFRKQNEFTPGIFADDEKSVSFSFKNLEKGSKANYSYTLKKSDPQFLGPNFFISMIPSELEVFSITFDEEIDLGWEMINCDDLNLEFKTSLEKGRKTVKWTLRNLPSTSFESDAPSMAHWTPHIVPFIKSYEFKGEKTEILGSVDALFKWYNSLVQQVDRSENKELKVITDSIISADFNDVQKVEAIFDWTKKNIKYVAVENGMNGFIPRSGESVCQKRYGDCKDMASIMHEMGLMCGVDINMAWIGSRSKPYTYKQLPSPMVDDHMIGAYKHDGDWIFLDATNRYCAFGRPTSFIQGKEALIRISDEQYEVALVPALLANENAVKISMDMKVEDQVLKGQAVMDMHGYYVDHYREALNDMDKEEKDAFYKDSFGKGNNKCVIKDVETSGLEERGDTLLINYNFEIASYLLEVDQELFVNLNLEKLYADYKLDEDRKYPRVFEYASLVEVESSLQIPEGYRVKSLPKSGNMVFDDFSFDLKVEQIGEKINLSTIATIEVLQLDEKHFSDWNEMINALRKLYRESLVLERI